MRKFLLSALLLSTLSINAKPYKSETNTYVTLPLQFSIYQKQSREKYSSLPFPSTYYFQKAQHQKAIGLGLGVLGSGIVCGGAFLDNKAARISMISTGGAFGLAGLVYGIKSIISGNKAVFKLEAELGHNSKLSLASTGAGVKFTF